MPSRLAKSPALPSRKRRRRQLQKQAPVPLLPPELADEELNVSDEDIKFVTKHRKYAGFLANLDTSTITKQVLGLRSVEDDENLETYYEKRVKHVPLHDNEDDGLLSMEPADVLPVKTLSGELQYRSAALEKSQGLKENLLSLEDRRAFLRKDKAGDKGTNQGVERGVDKVEEKQLTKAERRKERKRIQRQIEEIAREEDKSHHTSEASTTWSWHKELSGAISEEERLTEVKARIAELGTGVLADPENNLQSLKELQDFCGDQNKIVANLAMFSMLAVFKDLAPGYRIRLPTSKELEMQVSKEVRKLRNYEATLLRFYQKYVQMLISLVKSGAQQKTALRCVCGLLDAIPHFNYRDSLLAAVIPHMNSSDDVCSGISCEAVNSLFKSEGKHKGEATVEAVQLIADLVKVNDCFLRPETIQVFLSLSFDDDLSKSPASDSKHSNEFSEADDKRLQKFKTKWQEKKDKKSKKQQLAAKLREEVAADFKEASALPDTSDRKRLHTLTLSSIFETYFRILKTSSEPLDRVTNLKDKDVQFKLAKFGPRPLLGPCLNGLGRFSHLISVDFMGDLLGILQKLAAGTVDQTEVNGNLSEFSLTVAERLQCCVVAFSIVRSNLDALNIDLRDFYVHFYYLLLAYNSVRDEQNGILLAQALQVMLWDGRQHDMQRVAAFVKRLASQSLQIGSAEAMAALVTVRLMLQRYKKCRNMLENDGSGGAIGGNVAVFQAEATDPDLSGALSSILWEMTILSQHYHPGIAKLASQITKMVSSSEDFFLATLSPKDAVLAYCTSRGGFRPSIQPPRKPVKKRYLKEMLREPLCTSCIGLETNDEDIARVFASHFKVLRDIKKNETLRKDLNRVSTSLDLYKEFKAKRKKLAPVRC